MLEKQNILSNNIPSEALVSPRSLDYTSLQKPLFSTKHSIMAVVVVSLLGIVSLIGFAYDVLTGIAVLSISTVLCFVIFYLLRSHLRLEKLRSFAAANRAIYDESLANTEVGTLFGYGDERRNVWTIRLDSYETGGDVSVGEYIYQTGIGKDRKSHRWQYASLRLARPLPHFFLDATKGDAFGNGWPVLFDRSQRFELEGDFNKWFTLYIPENTPQDTLYIFTPDVMASLIDIGQDFDIEILHDRLYFYARHYDLSSEKNMRHILESFIKIKEKVDSRARLYNGTTYTPLKKASGSEDIATTYIPDNARRFANFRDDYSFSSSSSSSSKRGDGPLQLILFVIQGAITVVTAITFLFRRRR